MSIKFKQVRNINIPRDAIVSLKTMGKHYELCYSQCRNCNIDRKFPIKWLDKDRYINLYTLEVKERKSIKNRSENKKELARTFKSIRDYINTNVVDIDKCKWVTLTYKENMTNTEQLYKDNDKFMKRFRYKYGKDVQYIMVCEPQSRGAWHSHIIFIFNDKAPYIPNEEMENLWGHGFTKTRKINNIDNLGLYFTACLSDLELEEVRENNIEYKESDIKEVYELNGEILEKPKYFVKGARLSLYPPKFNIIRKSRGIKKPIKEYMEYKEAKEKVGYRRPTYSKTLELTDEEKNFNNIIKYEYYNLNKKC